MTTRKALINADRKEAINLAEIGETDYKEWSDIKEAGLKIRVRRFKANWILKFGTSTVTLGPVHAWSVDDARKMGKKVRSLLKSHIDPKPWIYARLIGASEDEAENIVLHRNAKAKNEWNTEKLMKQYRDEHVKKGRVVRGVRNAPSVSTLKDVESVMLQEPFTIIKNRLVRELNEETLETYRDSLIKSNGGSASRKGLAYLKAALSWARKHHSAASGLTRSPKWWLDVTNVHVEAPRNRMPTVEDLGMTIALAESARRLPGRSIDTQTSDTAIAALWLLVFTAHRREALISIESGQLINDMRDDSGWGLLYRPPHSTKARREHVLPIPPRAMVIMKANIDKINSSDAPWLFPATRLGENGKLNHMHGSTINKLLDRLRGKDKKSLDNNTGNMLEIAELSEPNWSPHDVRKTFATMVEDWTTRGDAVSAVLDHEGLGKNSTSRGAAAITLTAYNQSQRLPLKRLAMEPWCNAIIDAVEAARPRAEKIVTTLTTV